MGLVPRQGKVLLLAVSGNQALACNAVACPSSADNLKA